jgi:malate dehydrogenase (oxaloacetate-decarboxylating)
VVEHVKPTILIGCSTVTGAFSEAIVKTMAKNTKRPIIMALSNPTSKSEATPENLIQWTDGRAIIATGSPFPDVAFNEKIIRISQSNNAFAFPGIGLGVILCRPKHISDEMLWAATQTIVRCSPIHHDPSAPLLPKLSDVRDISREVAIAVVRTAQQQGLTQLHGEINFDQVLQRVMWEPQYYPYRKA